MRRDIRLPHLGYTLKVQRFKYDPKYPNSVAWHVSSSNDRHSSTIYIKSNSSQAVVAHELVHALQHLCAVRGVTFKDEAEHIAYIMQYWLETVVEIQKQWRAG